LPFSSIALLSGWSDRYPPSPYNPFLPTASPRYVGLSPECFNPFEIRIFHTTQRLCHFFDSLIALHSRPTEQFRNFQHVLGLGWTSATPVCLVLSSLSPDPTLLSPHRHLATVSFPRQPICLFPKSSPRKFLKPPFLLFSVASHRPQFCARRGQRPQPFFPGFGGEQTGASSPEASVFLIFLLSNAFPPPAPHSHTKPPRRSKRHSPPFYLYSPPPLFVVGLIFLTRLSAPHAFFL